MFKWVTFGYATSYVICSLVLQNCSSKVLPNIPVTQNVTFEKDILPITSTVCIDCHRDGVRDLREYKNAYSFRFSIRTRVAVDKTMPLGKELSDKQRALFRDWVDQGGSK